MQHGSDGVWAVARSATSKAPDSSIPFPQWRQCLITGRWVAIAPGRAARPHDFHPVQTAHGRENCPFCAGHEHETPAEVLTRRDPATSPDMPGWRVRVVSNKYPAVDGRLPLEQFGTGPFAGLTGFGVHEVIIESPEHVAATAQISAAQFAEVLWVYRQRLIDLRQDRRLKYGLIFKNLGEPAGASLEHLHSQLVALPMVPDLVEQELAGSLAYHRTHGRCAFCDMISAELAHGERVVMATDDFIGLCPYASRFPWEVWLLPRRHCSRFESLTDADLPRLAATMHELLARLERVLPLPAYNYYLHTTPFDSSDLEYYHWHVEVTPRVTNVAGFEWGTGFAVNIVAPEQAAEQLKLAK